MDEIALLDVPAMLSVIQQETQQRGNIIYIGHSLGTTMGMIYAAEHPEEAKNTIKLFIWISPSYKLTNMLSPYRLAAPFSPVITVSVIERNSCTVMQWNRITFISIPVEESKHLLRNESE